MANLQRDVLRRHLAVETMEISDKKVLSIGRLWVIAVGDVDYVILDILSDDKPRTTTKSHALALTDSMEPVTFVLAYCLARLQFYYFARLLA